MQDIVIYGAGGHAKVVAQSLSRLGRWRVVGFIDDVAPERAGEAFVGATVLGTRTLLPRLRADGCGAIALALGHNRVRLALGRELSEAGWSLPAIVDPSAVVAADVQLGQGVFVGAKAVVEPGVQIGDLTIINTAAVVCHDSHVGHGAHVCPRVCVGGHAWVDDGAWIGIGATVRDRARIGAWTLVGAGSLVLKDIPQGVVAYGTPAHVVSKADQ